MAKAEKERSPKGQQEKTANAEKNAEPKGPASPKQGMQRKTSKQAI